MTLALANQWTAGATGRRQTLNWLPPSGSADADMQSDRERARSRSRDLQRNNPLGRGAVNTVVTSVAGTGLTLRSRIDAEALGMSSEQAQEWQRQCEREFRLWAEDPSACDAERALDFYGLQALGLRSCLESGDVFATLPMLQVGASPYELKVQLVEADRVCNEGGRADTDTVCAGVERNGVGAAVKYHIARRHPGSSYLRLENKWDVVPAFGEKTGRRNVIHLYDKLRPGQARGMPYLAPVIEALRQLGEYSDAELRAALVASLFTVFIEAEAGFGLEPDDTGARATSTPQTGDVTKLGSGAIVELNKGDKISTANPGRPNSDFDPFVLAWLRQIGVALELPLEVLIKHFTSSYSASRAALLEAWRFFRARRAWLATNFCQPIFDAWLDEAIMKGRVSAPGYFENPGIAAAYRNAEWIGDSQGQLDPEKEANAAEKRLQLMLTTRADETVALTGQDWDQVVATRAREEQLMKESGLWAPPAPVGSTKQDDPRKNNDATDMEDENAAS